MSTKKIVRLTINVVVDENTDVKHFVQELDYDIVPMNDETVYETEIVDYKEVTY